MSGLREMKSLNNDIMHEALSNLILKRKGIEETALNF